MKIVAFKKLAKICIFSKYNLQKLHFFQYPPLAQSLLLPGVLFLGLTLKSSPVKILGARKVQFSRHNLLTIKHI
jgi:hypothetical protein